MRVIGSHEVLPMDARSFREWGASSIDGPIRWLSMR